MGGVEWGPFVQNDCVVKGEVCCSVWNDDMERQLGNGEESNS